jgi:hypothetical protein
MEQVLATDRVDVVVPNRLHVLSVEGRRLRRLCPLLVTVAPGGEVALKPSGGSPSTTSR